MTIKDYQFIASVLAEQRNKAVATTENVHVRTTISLYHQKLAAEFADRLSTENPRFDRSRFLDAAEA